MLLAAIAEDDRLQQAGPAEIVDVIDLDAGRDQGADRLDMAALAGRNQGGAAIAVGALQVGAMFKRQLEDREVPARAGIEIGAVVDGVLGIDVGAGLDQGAGGVDAVLMGGDQQGGLGPTVAPVDGDALGEEPLDRGNVVPGRGGVQSGVGHGLSEGCLRAEGQQEKNEGEDRRKSGQFRLPREARAASAGAASSLSTWSKQARLAVQIKTASSI